jgi:hypothetical protein
VRGKIREEKMKALLGTTLVAVFIACLAAPPMVLAQQKTAKECREEWRANKDANKAAGVTEKDYVAKCRAGGAAAQPSAAPAAPAAKKATPAAAPAAAGQAKTAKECRDEWRANKDANKKAGVTEKDYVAKCRAGDVAAQPPAPPAAAAPAAPAHTAAPPPAPAAAPAPAPAAAAPARPAAPAPAPTAAAPARPAATPAPSAADEFSTEAQAKARCPADTVVWVNLDSKIYHFSGYSNYGKTKEGAYMCEKDAVGKAFNAAKNEKHP